MWSGLKLGEVTIFQRVGEGLETGIRAEDLVGVGHDVHVPTEAQQREMDRMRRLDLPVAGGIPTRGEEAGHRLHEPSEGQVQDMERLRGVALEAGVERRQGGGDPSRSGGGTGVLTWLGSIRRIANLWFGLGQWNTCTSTYVRLCCW